MMYESAQAKPQNAPRSPSLFVESSELNERLSVLIKRLDAIGDRLHGPIPQEVGEATPPNANSIRGNLDLSYRLIAMIEGQVGRIEDRI